MTTDNNDLFNPASRQDNPLEFDIDQNKDYLTEYVGEGKKFADTKALAKAKAESDAHIARLEKEARIRNEDLLEVQNELKTRTRLEEIMDKLNQAKDTESPSKSSTKGNEQDTSKSGLSKDETASVAAEVYAKAEERRTRKTNTDLVKSKLVEKFGKNYAEVLKEKTNALGLTTEEATDLAERAPAALLEMIGVNREQALQNNAPVRSSLNSSSFDNRPQVEKTESYYEKIRKEDLALYNSPKMFKERREQAEKLGSKYFDLD